jgi:dTDP-4-dehydrorhamnose reductase
MEKVVVLGSTGMAGHVVAQYLQEREYDIYRVAINEVSGIKRAAIDVSNISVLEQWLDGIQPDIIVNCIGLLQKSSEERPDLAVMINSYLPRRLEYKYKHTETRLIHLSTDCVFSGDRGGYQEDDLPDGRTMYDSSKALGEINNHKDLTFRMSIIGPDRDPQGTGLFNWFMQQTGSIGGYRKAIWNGITTIELARGIEAAIKTGLTGLYHLVSPQTIDKYHLLQIVKEVFNRQIEINPVDTVVLDKSLINTRFEFDFKVKGYCEQIQDMYKWIKEHGEFYGNYDINGEEK